MHFDLSDEQKAFQDSVSRVLSDLVDLSELAQRQDQVDEIQNLIDRELSALGVPLTLAGEEAGGLGMGLLTLVSLAQVLGWHAAPSSILETAVAARLIADHGTARQQEDWLPDLLSGECAATFALSDRAGAWSPDEWSRVAAGARVSRMNVRALHRKGVTIIGTASGLAIADIAPEEFRRAGAPLDLTRPLASFEIASDRLEPLCDMAGAWNAYEALLILAAADAAGAGQRSLEMTTEYAKVREQFGRPIGSFQALKHQLANMATEVAPVHFPCWYAAHMWDLDNTGKRRAAFLAKAHATDVSVKAARSAVECHGGIAYTWEYPLHLFLKRAMQDRVTLSSPTALRKMIAELDDCDPTMDGS